LIPAAGLKIRTHGLVLTSGSDLKKIPIQLIIKGSGVQSIDGGKITDQFLNPGRGA
jgi:hypothetical protein